jgi:hypothetical protein
VSKDKDPKVDITSSEFQAGVDAGLNSTPATENWQAGLELGQTLKAEAENKQTELKTTPKEPTPLFLRNGLAEDEKNVQDEKDETEE